jgi:2-C-methyl-D-erythritol 4-phosphate cytidylyltransferase
MNDHQTIDISGRVDALVVAAGKGERMRAGQNKVFSRLAGVPILYRTLYRLNQISRIQQIVVVVRPEEETRCRRIIDDMGRLDKITAWIAGGQNRGDSVMNGLRYLQKAGGGQIVMVHDAARPLFSESMVQTLIREVDHGDIVAPALRITETIRRLNEQGRTETIDRHNLYITQTPQIFRYLHIEPCFLSNHYQKPLTDEIAHFEQCGKRVHLIEGEPWNIKITEPSDLVWAERWLKAAPELKHAPFD